jgi:photosystem I P700 chlorophyll a apoprotein A1
VRSAIITRGWQKPRSKIEFSTTHHAWIGGFFIVGSGAHAALFLVADYRAWSLPGLERVLAHRHSVVVHLNWVSIFLGFHAFGMYIHNDTLLALGRESDQFGDTGIPFRPVIGLPLTGLAGFESINLDGPGRGGTCG